jgi:hypothetical protein
MLAGGPELAESGRRKDATPVLAWDRLAALDSPAQQQDTHGQGVCQEPAEFVKDKEKRVTPFERNPLI